MTDAFCRTGGCRCGAVRFRATAAPLMTMACHCTGCQRMSGSAFSLSAAIPSAGFAVTQGQPVAGGVQGAEQWAHHRHCGHCKSWLFTEVPPEMGFVNVRVGAFDDRGGLAPFIETQTAEKLAWATTPAAHGFARFPEPDAYAALIADYPAWAAEKG